MENHRFNHSERIRLPERPPWPGDMDSDARILDHEEHISISALAAVASISYQHMLVISILDVFCSHHHPCVALGVTHHTFLTIAEIVPASRSLSRSIAVFQLAYATANLATTCLLFPNWLVCAHCRSSPSSSGYCTKGVHLFLAELPATYTRSET